MKKICNSLLASAAVVLAVSCSFDHDPIEVRPDPVFETSGLQRVTTNAIYKDDATVINIARTVGLSQEMSIELSVDPSLIEEYNTVYETDYTLLGAEYYSFPERVTLSAASKTAEVPVTFYPENLVKAVGMEQANNCMIPLRISGASVEMLDGGSLGYVLLTFDMETPQIKVDGPQSSPRLAFISGVPIPQTLVMSARTNFTTLDVSRISYRVRDDLVGDFNAAHADEGIDYQLLPESDYSFAEEEFDPETLLVTTAITFDCAESGGEGDAFVLPIELVQSGSQYDIEGEVFYVVINMSEMKIMLAKGSQLETTATGRGTIEVQLNAPLTEQQNVNLIYDRSLVDAYNSANGTDYQPIDPSKVTITATAIPAGSMSCNVEYAIDILDLPYDSDKYLIPLSIDESGLIEGTRIPEGSGTLYLEVDKTLVGDYFMECPYTSALIGTQDKSSQMNNFIKLSDKANDTAKYYFNYNSGWSDGKIYFNLSDEAMPGHDNCVRLVDFRDRDGADPITANASYLNLVTGEIVIDFIIESYWAPEPDGSIPGQIKGELRCVRLYR